LREGHRFIDAKTSAVTITPPLQGDDNRAKAIQDLMKKKFTGTEASIKDDVPEDCSMNIYKETDQMKVADLERSHAATDSWYHNGVKYYNPATG
jgi:hypothetical protein